MIYYPLSTLMLAGIREILVISTPEDTPNIERLLGDGSQIGVELSYRVQDEPRGIADAFRIGAAFIGDEPVCLILGDNIFYGSNFSRMLAIGRESNPGATLFGYPVHDPTRFGIVEFDATGHAVSIEEKPANPRSNWAVVGLYFYTSDVVQIAKELRPSARGELEITDVNRVYLEQSRLRAIQMGRGFAWLDTGTPSALQDAGNYVRIIEDRQGLKISCIEEVAYRMGFISIDELTSVAESMCNSSYRDYLLAVSREETR